MVLHGPLPTKFNHPLRNSIANFFLQQVGVGENMYIFGVNPKVSHYFFGKRAVVALGNVK